jgi:hypothetical protein
VGKGRISTAEIEIWSVRDVCLLVGPIFLDCAEFS